VPLEEFAELTDYNLSPSRYINTADAVTYRAIYQRLVQELEGIEIDSLRTQMRC
jgi:hypothetical protein